MNIETPDLETTDQPADSDPGDLYIKPSRTETEEGERVFNADKWRPATPAEIEAARKRKASEKVENGSD